jgi:hypothetical protein
MLSLVVKPIKSLSWTGKGDIPIEGMDGISNNGFIWIIHNHPEGLKGAAAVAAALYMARIGEKKRSISL